MCAAPAAAMYSTCPGKMPHARCSGCRPACCGGVWGAELFWNGLKSAALGLVTIVCVCLSGRRLCNNLPQLGNNLQEGKQGSPGPLKTGATECPAHAAARLSWQQPQAHPIRCSLLRLPVPSKAAPRAGPPSSAESGLCSQTGQHTCRQAAAHSGHGARLLRRANPTANAACNTDASACTHNVKQKQSPVQPPPR